MADVSSQKIVENRRRNPFRSWDAFDRLFDEAFSRSKSRPLSPDIVSPSMSHFAEPQPYVHAHAGATPYAAGSPVFSYSNESLGFSAGEDPDPDRGDDAFDQIWNEGLRRTRRSTVTTKTVRRTRRAVEGSGSNSTSTSNTTSTSGLGFPLPATPPPPPPPPPAATSAPPPLEQAKSPKPKRRKSKVNFQDSTDGRTVTATFELPGINKSDVHVSYQTDKVVVSWQSVTTSERTEGDRIIRERKEKKYVRTLPLPEGTKFEEIRASMDGRHLVLTYPKFKANRTPPPVQIIEIKTD